MKRMISAMTGQTSSFTAVERTEISVIIFLLNGGLIKMMKFIPTHLHA